MGNFPWLLGGDLNEILSDNEKLGGPLRERINISGRVQENFR